MPQSEEYKKISLHLNKIEKEVKEFAALRKKEKEPWNREAEQIMDKIAIIGAYMHDTLHNLECKVDPNCPKYRRSMLFRIRRALRFDI